MRRLLAALTVMACLWLAVACGADADDRMVRRYAECMVDPNTALHRLMVSGAVGTVALSADAMEKQLHARLLRGEIAMSEISASYVRYCE